MTAIMFIASLAVHTAWIHGKGRWFTEDHGRLHQPGPLARKDAKEVCRAVLCLRHPIHLLNGGDTLEYLGGTVAGERNHAVFDRPLFDLVGIGGLQDQRLHILGHGQQFKDATASPIAGMQTFAAAPAAVDFLPGADRGIKTNSGQHLRSRLVFFLAMRADDPHQPLGEDGIDRGGDEEGFDPHIAETGYGPRGIVGVQGREDQVTG